MQIDREKTNKLLPEDVKELTPFLIRARWMIKFRVQLSITNLQLVPLAGLNTQALE